MEILFISHKYPPAVGGMEKQSFELINGMKRFATVHSIVYDNDQNRIQFFYSLEKRIVDMLQKYPAITIIHFNDALVASFSMRHTRYNHIFRAVTVHGLDVVFPSSIYQKFIFPKFNRFDLIIAVSQATASACIARGIAVEKVAVINNGVDHSLLNVEPDINFHESFLTRYGIDLRNKIVLTSLGRPVKRKGLSWFLDHVVPKLEGDFVFLLVGPFSKTRTRNDRLFNFIPTFIRSGLELFLGYPTDENKIRELLTEQRFINKVIHLGKLPYNDLLQILTATDAFIMPNIAVEGDMEGFGLVCLEASLCGAWVFASEIDGITDAIHHHKNGTLLASESVSDWVLSLNNFIKNPSDFQKQQLSAKSYTKENFGWDKMAASYFDLFNKKIQDHT